MNVAAHACTLAPVPGDGIARLVDPPACDRDGRILLWWLGQAGFALRAADQLLLIDPYLSDSLRAKHARDPLSYHRLLDIPVAPERLTNCTWVLCTHGHGDHMDPETLASLRRFAMPHVLVPRAEQGRAIARGADPRMLVTIDADERLQLADGISVSAVASAHERLEIDERGQSRYLGYVLDIDGTRVYHSGDCVPYPGLAERLAALRPDVALLPVNGRDAKRRAAGVPGNFTLDEAVALCREASIGSLVAHHIGMFAFNTLPADDVRSSLLRSGGVRGHLLNPGGAYVLGPAT